MCAFRSVMSNQQSLWENYVVGTCNMCADCSTCVTAYAMRGVVRPLHQYIVARQGTVLTVVICKLCSTQTLHFMQRICRN